MKKVAVALLAASLLGGCQADEPSADPGTDFTLTGRVAEVRTGVEPEGVPDTDSDTDVDPGTGGDRNEGAGVDEPGAMIVVVEGDVLEECATNQNAYTVFYEQDTRFEPAGTTEGRKFPDNLVGTQVEITGTFYSAEADDGSAAECALIAENVTVSKAAPTAEPRRTPAPTGTPTPRPAQSPGASPSPPAETSAATAAP